MAKIVAKIVANISCQIIRWIAWMIRDLAVRRFWAFDVWAVRYSG